MYPLFLVIGLFLFSAVNGFAQGPANTPGTSQDYQYEETRDLVSLVHEAASAVEAKGEAVFPEFKEEGSKWRDGDAYLFILDPDGNMVLHPDPALEGKNESELKDINGKPIIRSLIAAAAGDKKEGWFHYQWPEPGSLFPLWKSSFVKRVSAPSGKEYIVGSGLYNMKMEKEFIVAVVDAAAELIETEGKQAFAKLRDKAGPFLFMDTYVFVDNPEGVEVVNGAFPNIEGRNLMDYKDSHGDELVRKYIHLALTNGAGWVDYYWPKPGQANPSKKQTYVRKVTSGDDVWIVGSGAYLD